MIILSKVFTFKGCLKKGRNTVPAKTEVLYFPNLLERMRNVILVSPLYLPPDRLVARLNILKLLSKSESKIIFGSDLFSSSVTFESRVLFSANLRARLRLVKVFLGGQTVTRGKGRSVMGR